MKFLFALLLSMIFISCSQNSFDSRIASIGTDTLHISDNKDIFGTWSMCATSSDGIMTQMNTCRKIFFNIDGQGYIKTNDLITENFSWKLDKMNMKIFTNISNGVGTFSDTNYFADFSNEKGIINLMLRHKDESYFLSK